MSPLERLFDTAKNKICPVLRGIGVGDACVCMCAVEDELRVVGYGWLDEGYVCNTK